MLAGRGFPLRYESSSTEMALRSERTEHTHPEVTSQESRLPVGEPPRGLGLPREVPVRGLEHKPQVVLLGLRAAVEQLVLPEEHRLRGEPAQLEQLELAAQEPV